MSTLGGLINNYSGNHPAKYWLPSVCVCVCVSIGVSCMYPHHPSINQTGSTLALSSSQLHAKLKTFLCNRSFPLVSVFWFLNPAMFLISYPFPVSHHSLLVSEKKPPSVMTVLVGFYRLHLESFQPFSSIFHSTWGNYYFIVIISV